MAYATDDAMSSTGAVSGTVTNLGEGGVEDLAVSLLAGSDQVAATTSDAAGKFTFAEVATGEYTVTVSLGAESASDDISVVADATATVHIELGTGFRRHRR